MTEDILSGVDPLRRNALRTLIFGTAFALPVVASFSMGAATPAHAQQQPNQIVSNQAVSNQSVPALQDAALVGLTATLVGAGLIAAAKKSSDQS